jgi:hypothetical protein
LLDLAWAQQARDPWLVTNALRCVCRTFASNPDESATLLRRAIEPGHLAAHGWEEMHEVTSELRGLMNIASDLVAEIYEAVLAYEETSNEETAMGHSRLLAMRSNRRQDFEMAQWELGELFPSFLSTVPEVATKTLMRVLQQYVTRNHPVRIEERIEKSFAFLGVSCRVLNDYSAIWDGHGTHDHDVPIKMLNTFQDHLAKLAQGQDRSRLRRLLDVAASENSLAVVWKRLLEIGAREPSGLGVEIASMSWAPPILAMDDTTTAAGNYLAAIFPYLHPENRERIERTVLAIPEEHDLARMEDPERTRDRLLGCLEPASLVTADARRRREQLRTAGSIPKNEPPFRFESFSGPYGERDYLADEGVDVDAEANRRLQELEAPIISFSEKHLNSAPTLGDVTAVARHLRELRDAISGAIGQGAHQRQREYARGVFFQACARMAQCADLPDEPPILEFVQAALLEASADPDPAPDPEADAAFDSRQAWGGRSIRIGAAQGLMHLTARPGAVSSEIVAAIQRLSRDPVPAVRYQIVSYLPVLFGTDRGRAWSIAEWIAQEDLSSGVLRGLLASPLRTFLRYDPSRVASLTRHVLSRTGSLGEPAPLRDDCITLLSLAYVWYGDSPSADALFAAADTSDPSEGTLRSALFSIRSALTYGPIDPAKAAADAARKRALSVYRRFLESNVVGLQELEATQPSVPISSWPAGAVTAAKAHARAINYVATELYFASGAHEGRLPDGSVPTFERRRRFYSEAGPLLETLADIGFAAVSHHLLQLLELMIPVDPAGVFRHACRVLRAGTQGGYQFERQGVRVFVRFVSRYLAEYRTLLQSDVELRKGLLEVLDVFVRAGGPEARSLVYRLDELFR